MSDQMQDRPKFDRSAILDAPWWRVIPAVALFIVLLWYAYALFWARFDTPDDYRLAIISDVVFGCLFVLSALGMVGLRPLTLLASIGTSALVSGFFVLWHTHQLLVGQTNAIALALLVLHEDPYLFPQVVNCFVEFLVDTTGQTSDEWEP